MSSNRSAFSIARIGMVFVIVIASAAVASAYTLVMRSGRRVEIPNQFVVSGTNLLYEISPGIQVSVQLVSVDVAATEQANNEAPGSFAKRVIKPAISPQNRLANQALTRVITNQDLERIKSRRVASETAYERRRKELGLPSLEESRKRAAIEAEQSREEMKQSLAEQSETEQYWRNRASSLRTELSAMDAQIQYLRNRINETPVNPFLWASPGLLPFVGISSSVIAPGLRPQVFPHRSVYTAPRAGPRVVVRGNIGGPRFPGRGFTGPARNFRPAQVGSPFPFGTVLSSPWQSYDYPYDRSTLLMQLDDLLRQKAGLQARWRELEDEARRAGAYPGWLRP